jgi:hypothetical protein
MDKKTWTSRVLSLETLLAIPIIRSLLTLLLVKYLLIKCISPQYQESVEDVVEFIILLFLIIVFLANSKKSRKSIFLQRLSPALGDLIEVYCEIRSTRGAFESGIWFCKQVLNSIPYFIVQTVSNARYRNLTQRLQPAASIVGIFFLAILFIYWNVLLQSSPNSLEKNQRMVEMAASLANFWEEQLDQETRYRLARFIALLKSSEYSPEEKNKLLESLVETNILEADSIRSNLLLNKLIGLYSSPENPSRSKTDPIQEVFKYRSTLIRVLNTMEMIAIVRQHTKDLPKAKKVIDSAYRGAIRQRYDDLMAFIGAYRQKYSSSREIPPWAPLDDMIREIYQ